MAKSSWFKERGIQNIECIIPDINGVPRGKVLPADKVSDNGECPGLKFPMSVFAVTVMGDYTGVVRGDEAYRDVDLSLQLDMKSLRRAPGGSSPTAYVFADPHGKDGAPWKLSPRDVLKSILDLYRQKNWLPVIAPELEFYLTAPNTDPNQPLSPPMGRSGRPEFSAEPYGLEAIEEFQPIIDQIYEAGKIAGLDLDTLIHESGRAQLEINFKHGDPLGLADQVILFKRIVRQVALAHGCYATFMAKPIEGQPGSSMHLHVSVVDHASGKNVFADAGGEDSALFLNFVGGLQTYLPQVMPLFAPFVNSFRRLIPGYSAPINVHWGLENRTCGLRVPESDGSNRRIENRLPGADANPYLAMAATLLAGYLGMTEKLTPSPQALENAYRHEHALPKTMDEALAKMEACEPILKVLDAGFVYAYCNVKKAELREFQSVITPWERQHLLLKV